MDIFIEQLIKKKPGPLDYLICIGIIIAGVFLVFLSVLFLLPLAILVLAGVCYGAYYLIRSRSLEFEYSVTNGDITIDKIIAKQKRKRVISVDAHAVEEMGKYNPQKHRAKAYGKRIVVSETQDGNQAWYFCARQPEMGNVLVVFSPDERTLNAIRPFLPRQVAKDAFGRY
ncbi:MAG: hypothetical protein LKJ17_00270 [Oscillospiraceae bacterium]|jgi:Co/Zn/Cd efflux system component|nr:hypothetical protein [Oscillospiraceae bacterium]